MKIKRIRICSRGIWIDLALLTLLIFLVYTFYSQYQKSNHKHKVVNSIEEDIDISHLSTIHEVEEILKSEKTDGIRDVRSDDCRGRHYMRDVQMLALVIHFFDYEFYDIKNTLSSCVRGNGQINGQQLIGEIIIIDDGSTLQHIVDEARVFFAKMKPIVRLIRSSEHRGAAKSRKTALDLVTLDLVVFLDCTVICSPGWLEPLVDILLKHPDRQRLFILPHHDRILHPVSLEYEKMQGRTRAAMSWGLRVRMLPTPDKVNVDGLYRSTVMRGNVFATTKSFLDRLGSFDTELDEGGGDVLELSLRAWMCGGAILTTPCSRVGIINLKQRVSIASSANLQRIANMWFGSGATPVLTLAGSADLAVPMKPAQARSVQERLAWLKANLQCRDINWFLRDVAGLTAFPTGNVVKFGLLRAGSDAYASVSADRKIDMLNMPEEGVATKMNFIFELTKQGTLVSAGKCVTSLKSSHVLMETCRDNDRQQAWEYSDQMLKSKWSGSCATHVTDPDKGHEGRQILMVQSCTTDKQDQEKFKKWTFVDI